MRRSEATLPSEFRAYVENKVGAGFECVAADGSRRDVFAPELHEHVRGWAAHLRHAGVQPGDRVALSIDRVDLFVTLFWACQFVGAVPTTLTPLDRRERVREQCDHIRAIIAVAEPKLLILDSPVVAPTEIQFDLAVMRADVAVSACGMGEPFDADPNSIALIQFTSGSTSTPRGCALSHRAVIANARAILRRGGGHPGDVNVHWVPLSHDMGLMAAVIAPVCGHHHSIVMHPRRFMLRPLSWIEEMANRSRVHTSVPNFALVQALRRANRLSLGPQSLAGVLNVICGAEPIDAAVVRSFFGAFAAFGLSPDSFQASYGLAEATVMVASRPGGLKTITRSSEEASGSPVGRTAREYVSVGRPVDGAEVRIVDEAGECLAEEEQGEIELRSHSLMDGYYADDAATGEKIVNGWLKTGDLGFLRDENLYISGRRGDLIIIGGKNIFAGDLETRLAQNLDLDARKIVALSLQGRHGTDELFLVIEAKNHRSDDDIVALASRICQQVCGFLPSRVLIRPSGTIPKTTSGKIKRGEVRKLCLEGKL